MSLYTLLLFFFYLLVILLTGLILITLFPLNISLLSNVDGFYYDAKLDFSVLLGLLNGTTDLHLKGGSFKLFVFSFPIYSTYWFREEKELEKKKPEKKPITKPKKRKRDLRILIKPIKRLFYSSIRIMKIKKLDVSLITGLSDPYVSGMTFGIIYPLIETLKVFFPGLSFSLTPVFVEERFKSMVDGSISLIIIMFFLLYELVYHLSSW